MRKPRIRKAAATGIASTTEGGRPRAVVLLGNCLDVLSRLNADTFDTVVTSPPYYGLRDYGVPGQLGLEKHPDDYVASMVAVFHEVHRVLRKRGTLWLVIGDSYAGYHGNQNSKVPTSAVNGWVRGTNENTRGDRRPADIGLKQKDLIGIPWRVALALQADGWYLRQDIVWAKPHPAPEAVIDRCVRAHEYLFLFSKVPRYYFDLEAIKEPAVRGGTRIRRSVWEVGVTRSTGHIASFPLDLVSPCILAGSPPGGHVLDPFSGSGTTGIAALQHGRAFTGIEIQPSYVEMAQDRLHKATHDPTLARTAPVG